MQCQQTATLDWSTNPHRFPREYWTNLTNVSTLSVLEVEIWRYRGGETIPPNKVRTARHTSRSCSASNPTLVSLRRSFCITPSVQVQERGQMNAVTTQ
ncbi:uncharacterized protein EDB91DRAFT_1169807, partial [Suillus paluster]|uniref:uncharacterized protein n=1 Tax=Suillus paluster TaxID=48578 RepID=UPI001B885C09